MSLDNPQVTSYGVEIGAFCVAMGGLSLSILDSLSGQMSNIDKFIANRSWDFLKTDETTYNRYVTLFTIFIWILVLMAPIALGAWVGTLFYHAWAVHESYMPPVAVLTVGLFVMCSALGISYLKWNGFKMSTASNALFGIAGASFIIYQVAGNFLDVEERSFFGITAVFLSYNAILFMLILFLNSGKDAVNFMDILNDIVPVKSEAFALDDAQDFAAQIQEHEANKDYVATKEEIDQYFTIKEEDAPLLRGGVIRDFGTSSAERQFCISVIIYAFSVAILIAYAFIIYNTTKEYKVGFITFIAVITTDTIMYSFYYAGVSQSVLQLCFMSIVFRICLFGFGGTYWYYGYCVLYGILGIIVCGNIAGKYFPLIDAIQIHLVTAEAKDPNQFLKDLMKTPEFILIWSTVLFLILTLCLIAFKPDGVPLPSLYSSGSEFKYWALALLAFGIVVLSYLLMAMARILIRRRQQIMEDVHVYFFAKPFDIFWIHTYLCWLFLIVCGVVSYAITDYPTFLILAAFIPLAIILVLYIYIYYSVNDYRVLKDIKAENRKRAYLRKSKEKQADVNVEVVPASQNPPLEMQDYKEEIPPAPGSSVANKEPLNAEGGDQPKEAGEEEKEAKEDENAEQKKSDAVSKLSASKAATMLVATNAKDTALIDFAIEEAHATDELEDWTETTNVICAFFQGKLHANDYRIIFGFIGVIAILICDAVILQATKKSDDDSWFGVTLNIILIDVFLFVCGNFRYLRTDLWFDIPNIIVTAFSIIVHVVYGIIYFLARESADMDKNSNLIWCWFYIVFVPAAVCLGLGIYKWHTKNWKINPYTIIMTVAFIGFTIIFMFMLWGRFGWLGGAISLGVAIIVGYGAVLTYIYASNGYFMPAKFYLVNIIIGVIIACGIMVASWVIPEFPPFIGFSVTYWIIDGAAIIYFFLKLIGACQDYQTAPIFLSAYVFPVHVYNGNRQASVSYDFNTIGLYCGLLLAVLWGILASIWLQPMHTGIAITCLVIVLLTFMTFFFVTYTALKLLECREFINKDVLTKGWLRAKKRFIEAQNALNMEELITYKELQNAHNIVENKIDSDDTEHIRLSSRESFKLDIGKMTDKQQHDLLFEIEDELKDRYYDEIRLMIDFQLNVMIGALSAQVSFQNKVTNFLKNKEDKLREFGIEIKWKAIVDPLVRHSMIMAQVKKLNSTQRTKYDELWAEFEVELEKARQKAEALEKASNEAEQQRNQKLLEQEKKAEKEKEELAKVDIKTLPLEKMPDCLFKYEKIKAEFNETKQWVDNQFPPNAKSLGEHVCKEVVLDEWKKPDPGMAIYVDDANALDVRQGFLGDCYFLSAISVLGHEKVSQCIACKIEDTKCGAFCVKIYKRGEEESYVIVDNNFPKQKSGDWAYVKSESGKELWPMILEKAYAKMYGSYNNIEGGKVQYALADLTGGAPEQIKLESVCDNLDAFWSKIYAFHQAGYLMGAGSPEHPNGDRAVSRYGVVQGHAYGVLDLVELDPADGSEKLLKLRNPVGSAGIEWNGDWADGSAMWTEALRTKLKQEDKEDGTFWISLSDFTTHFANLYVCRVFDSKWKKEVMEGVWKGKTAAGLPGKNNPGAKIENNPHYLINVNRPSTLFIKLSQKEKVDMFKGQNSIYYVLANNGGKRIVKAKGEETIATSFQPTCMLTISGEVVLDDSLSYPCKLSLMVCTMAGGPSVNASYSLTVYSTDLDFKISPM